MKEEAYEKILDRHTSAQYIREHFQDSLELLREVTNYGSRLIPRCFVSSKRKLPDIVVLGVLLKQAVAMLDAVEVLVSQGALYAAHVPARALFEAYLYINWILQKDKEKRATYYYVWQLRRLRTWDRRVIPTTSEHLRFKKAIKQLNLSQDGEKQQDASKEISEIDKLLSKDGYKEINAEFDKIKMSNRDYDKQWYLPCGAKSIADMARQLEIEPQYDIFYAQFSEIAHAQSFRKHILVKGKGIVFEPIRHLEGIRSFLTIVLALAIGLYQSVLNEYRSGELPNFSRKYLEEWRSRFLSIKDVKYTVSEDTMI
jgi:hypothetical protein